MAASDTLDPLSRFESPVERPSTKIKSTASGKWCPSLVDLFLSRGTRGGAFETELDSIGFVDLETSIISPRWIDREIGTFHVGGWVKIEGSRDSASKRVRRARN